MEPHATIAAWDGDRLHLWSKSQFVANEQVRSRPCSACPQMHVRVIWPFVGGAFGTALRTWPHVTIAAIGARHVNRAGQARADAQADVLQRQATGRVPCSASPSAPAQIGKLTRHRARGHGRDVALRAVRRGPHHHHVPISIPVPTCARAIGLAPTDISTPTYMRAPGEASGVFAVECAMDELAGAARASTRWSCACATSQRSTKARTGRSPAAR